MTYDEINEMLKALIVGVPHRNANLANAAALLFQTLPNVHILPPPGIIAEIHINIYTTQRPEFLLFGFLTSGRNPIKWERKHRME